MIPATQHYALFNSTDNGTVHRPIIAWDDEGHGLALAPSTSQLARARDMPGFIGIVEDTTPVVAVLPGAGWLVEYGRPDGAIETSPVVGWAVRANGEGFALGLSEDGNCEGAAELQNYRRVFHPDHDTEPPAGRKRR